MLRKVYSVRDVKAAEYLGLVIFKTELEAQRFFLLSVTDKRGTMWRFPRDYVIHEVGTFDTETGVLARREPVPGDVTPYGVLESFLARNENGASEKSESQAGAGSAGSGVSAGGGQGVSG